MKFRTLADCKKIYDEKAQRSRTIVDGVKAVKLDKFGMRNSTLRPDNTGGFIVRYHRTDIAYYTADGYCTVTTKNWNTPSTFERIRDVAGAYLCTTSARAVTDQSLRFVYGRNVREGTANRWMRSTTPFFNGMRFRDGVLHPDDEEKIPSERRIKYETPTVATRKAFAKLWSQIKGRVMLGVTLGVWPEKMLQAVPTYFYLTQEKSVKTLMSHQILTEDELFHTFKQGLIKSQCYRPTQESLMADMKRHIPKFRKALLLEYARQTDGFEWKGGEILRNGYYVKKGD